jgi:hypothetical protein
LLNIVNTFNGAQLGATRFTKGNRPQKVIVVGAGISKAIGLPVANELLREMFCWHQNRTTAVRLDMITEFLEAFYPGCAISSGEYPDVEDALGMLETANTYNEIRGQNRGYKWRPEITSNIKSRFIRLLGEYLWSFQSSLKPHDLEILRQFVRHIGTGSVYVSFNYDLTLESALSYEGIPYSYGLPLDPNGVCILKPHGSINWFSPESAGKAANAGWTKLGDDILVTPSCNPSTLQFANWKEAVMIPPTPSKQIGTRDLKKIWTSFSSSITSARQIIIGGYSLPNADRLARLVLRRAGPRHSATKRIAVINPDPSVEGNFAQNVSPRFNFLEKNFQAWRDDGFNIP